MVPAGKASARNLKAGSICAITLLAVLSIAMALSITRRGNEPEPTGRASITVQSATITGPLVQHNVPTATILLKNTGSSAARATKTRLVMTVWTAPTLPDWEMPLQLTHDVQSLGDIEPGSCI